jgi:hypothetical protein
VVAAAAEADPPALELELAEPVDASEDPPHAATPSAAMADIPSAASRRSNRLVIELP